MSFLFVFLKIKSKRIEEFVSKSISIYESVIKCVFKERMKRMTASEQCL